MTVRGAVSPETLGVVLPHEHVLLDLSCIWHEPDFPWQRELVDSPPTLANRGLLCSDPYVSKPNLLLDEVDVAREELHHFKDLGGGCVVDLTTGGIGPRPEEVRDLAVSTGLHIVMGCGFYVQRAHPPNLHFSSESSLAHRLTEEITQGFGTTGVRPGIIGELGTSSPIHEDEARVLRAAARVQRETGLAINVHVAIFAREALNALQVMDEAGADLSRVVVSHLDENLDAEYHRAVLQTGAYVEFDTFGSEFYFDGSGEREPSDHERIAALLGLLDAGWERQLLLSQDVCTRMHLRRYGGYGYGHILRSIVPRLRRRGVTDEIFELLLRVNPARVLTIDG